MKMKRNQIHYFFFSKQHLVIVADSLNIVKECISLDFNYAANQVRYLFNAVLFYYCFPTICITSYLSF